MRRALLVLLVACRTTHDQPPAMIEVADVLAQPSNELDLLLLIDDSNGGPEHEYDFGLAVPALLGKLATIPGGMPSLHIGVATSDMGTTGSLDYAHPAAPIGQFGNGGCIGHGRDGALQLGRATATDAFLVDEPDGAGGRRTNYQGTLVDAIAKLVNVGGGGCGFEQHFAGIQRALANPANAGFRRAGANLGVVILADEDDCSVIDPAFFSPTAPDLGPLQSFRCTQFGVRCDEGITEVGTKSNCIVRDDSTYIQNLDPIRAALGAAAPDPAQLALFAIVGNRAPFDVEWVPPPGGGTPDLWLLNSCQFQRFDSISAADPGVRIAQLADSLGSHGGVASICAQDQTPQLAQLGRQLARMHGVLCIEGELTDCTASDVAPTGDETELPACPADGDCVELVHDPAACNTPTELRAVIDRKAMPPLGTHVVVRCQPS